MMRQAMKLMMWVLPLQWLHPRETVKAIAQESAHSSGIVLILASVYGLTFGVDLAARVAALDMRVILAILVGPLMGIAIVFGFGQLIQEGYARRGTPSSVQTIRAATVVALNPLSWGWGIMTLGRWITANAEAVPFGLWLQNASQVVGLVALFLPWLALRSWHVGLSEATGIPEDQISKRPTTKELLLVVLAAIVFVVGWVAAAQAGWF